MHMRVRGVHGMRDMYAHADARRAWDARHVCACGCEACMHMRMRDMYAHADARRACACACEVCMHMRMRGVHAHTHARHVCTCGCEARMRMRMRGMHAHADARHACTCGCKACMHMRMRGVHVDARHVPGHGEFPHIRRLVPQLPALLRLAILSALQGELVQSRRRDSIRPR